MERIQFIPSFIQAVLAPKQNSIDNSDNISENNKKTTSPESIKQEIQKMNTENLNSKENNNDNIKSKTNQIDENTTDEDTDFEDERRKRLKTEKKQESGSINIKEIGILTDDGSETESENSEIGEINQFENEVEPIYNFQKKKSFASKCAKCATSDTPQWRTGPDGSKYCNACGLAYMKKRPQIKNKMKKIRRKSSKCYKCGVTQTRQWRTGPNGITLCNACGLRFAKGKLQIDGILKIPQIIQS